MSGLMAPIEITPANQQAVTALFKTFNAAALQGFTGTQAAPTVMAQDSHAGNLMTVWQTAARTQIGVLHYADGEIGIFSPVSVVVPLDDNQGMAVLMTQNGRVGVAGEAVRPVKTAQVVDPRFANDILHVMQHAVNKPHNCAGTPHP